MFTYYTTLFIVGLILIFLGVMNMRGNIASIHWYHRQRVTEENKKPFGKLVGGGTLIVGVSLIVFGIFNFLFEKTQVLLLLPIGFVLLGFGILLGLGLSFYGMIKYNKGIF